MKVTDVKAFVVDCYRTNWVFVKVYTDEGTPVLAKALWNTKKRPSWVRWSILRNTW